jgi:antibiotic biosynthesis monooxygenase (ABM) superfamily enzyme
MEPSTSSQPPHWELQAPRASAVIVQHVPAAATDRFLEWQRGVTKVAEGFAGYRTTELYPPAAGQPDPWVTVVHFDKPESLQTWLDSSERGEWTDRLHREIGDFRVKTLPSGFGPWFAGLVSRPPGWKIMLTVLLGLYPTVMLLAIVVGPWISPLGLAVAMLISNALSVCLLQWLVMPVLNRLAGRWLTARPQVDRVLTVVGTVLILALLAGMAVVFHRVKG